MEESLKRFMNESAKRHEKNSNLIKEIQASTNAAIRNQEASIKTFEIQIRATRLDDSLSRKEKDPGSFTLPCFINNICFENALADLGASVNVMHLSTYLNLGIGELAHTKLTIELVDRTVKYPKGIAENVLVGNGEVVDKPMIKEVKTRNDDKMVSKIIKYPSYCDFDEKIHTDCTYNLKFSCMIGFELVYANFFPILPINVMSKTFYNSIIKDKIEFRGRNELGNFVNALVFIGNFYVITDFIVVKDMDPYLDEGMGDVIVGEPFCKASCMKARRFDGIITIHDEDDSVTYQMAWSNPRFKHLTNEKCNKILPLPKVSEQDKMNGISHSYQKLKGFYKGVLNLEPDFIRDTKVKEWLTRRHISVHEMK
ncbi:homeodomain-like protein [Tanacetum coccineum]